MKLLLLLPLFCWTVITTASTKAENVCPKKDAILRFPHDVMCNNGTMHACICYWADYSLREVAADCLEQVADEKMMVVGLTVKNMDLSGIIWTGEPYESFFKRKIANLVSKHCEEKANECPGTALTVEEKQVVILRVECRATNTTKVKFAIVKATNIHVLRQTNTMDPAFITRILSPKLKKLERLLGMATISDLSTTEVDKGDSDSRRGKGGKKTNTVMMVILACVGLFLMVTYVIAIYKVCKDYHQRKEARKQRQQNESSNNKTPKSYGATSSRTDTMNHTMEVPARSTITKSSSGAVPRPKELEEQRRRSSASSSSTASRKKQNGGNKTPPQPTVVGVTTESNQYANDDTIGDAWGDDTVAVERGGGNDDDYFPIATEAIASPIVNQDHFDRFEASLGTITKSLSNRSISRSVDEEASPGCNASVAPADEWEARARQQSSLSPKEPNVSRSATLHDFPEAQSVEQQDRDSSSPSTDEEDAIEEAKFAAVESDHQLLNDVGGGFEDNFLESIGSYKVLQPSLTNIPETITPVTSNDPWKATEQPTEPAIQSNAPQANGGLEMPRIDDIESVKKVQKKVTQWPGEQRRRRRKKRRAHVGVSPPPSRPTNGGNSDASTTSSSSASTSDISDSASDAENLLATGEYLQLAESIQSLDKRINEDANHFAPAPPPPAQMPPQPTTPSRTEDDDAWELGYSLR